MDLIQYFKPGHIVAVQLFKVDILEHFSKKYTFILYCVIGPLYFYCLMHTK